MLTVMCTIGFDLDLTLADTRAGIGATFEELSRRLGVPVDTDAVISRLGPPLETELAYWMPAEEIPAAADLYRELYPRIAVPATTTMPGAREAVAAVREAGGRVIVVTGKNTADAKRTVAALDLHVDAVEGALFGAGKGVPLASFGADAYVGDHVADIAAARAGDAVSVTVATGPYTAGELREHGADVVLADLREFGAWFRRWRAEPPLA
ncbi:HAD hydrolase-like protein [Spongiactinospora sp. TRM90649]|uniref:HAD family hydrolase n=1 Tax=Spongiactinospora sp. TRM90649 TaxID=3031114 RepID=UPI0023F9E5EA|nr:HAD hydrolase-like protein [Spongiactinospora sp. TRM90649]MDF5757816.1 HAD hydrolase-like protein [Spongiactinospora sp. TRM90649]